jgi:hypothetical protein
MFKKNINMFEDLDFSKLKLPIEPQNLVYIYLAYKLINNLDKINLQTLGRKPAMPLPKSINTNNFIFLIFIIIGSSFIFLNNILNRISFSSISVENLSAQDPESRNRVAKYTNNKCPIRLCPLFANCDSIKEQLNKCIQKNTSKLEPEGKNTEEN